MSCELFGHTSGTYTAEGIITLADALRVTVSASVEIASVTQIDVRDTANDLLGDEGACIYVLLEAVEGRLEL